MKNTIFIATLFAILLLGASEAAAQTVSIGVGKGGVSKGKTNRAYVRMNIPNGLHVNSNNPKSEYSIATRVTVSADDVSVGGVTYPPGKMKKFSFSETPISVYENRVTFPFSVTVPAGFSDEFVTLRARVRYQACTDEVCYPPRTKLVSLNVRVR